MHKEFIVSLIEDVLRKRSHICVGLDPDLNRIPAAIKEKALNQYGYNRRGIAQAILEFNQEIIEAVKDIAVAVKPQIAWFEEYGHWGFKALEETIAYSHHRGLLTILDVKRGDIGSTAQAYARAYLGRINFWEGKKKKIFNADAITLNPYLGLDSLQPFLDMMEQYRKGAFLLVKTSNPGGQDIQDLLLQTGEPLYQQVARYLHQWSGEHIPEGQKYSRLGAVVGATYPQAAHSLRQEMPNSYFLVPGYGAQGAKARDLLPFFNPDGLGAVINASRSIIYAYENNPSLSLRQATREAALSMREEINQVLQEHNCLAWE